MIKVDNNINLITACWYPDWRRMLTDPDATLLCLLLYRFALCFILLLLRGVDCFGLIEYLALFFE